MTGPGMIAGPALVLVAAGLVVTACAQIRPMRRLRTLLDLVALVPEWRFFAQASLSDMIDFARDTHLVVRDRDADGDAGPWQPAVSHAARRWHHAVWNPHNRVNAAILTFGEDLARDYATGRVPAVQQTPRYIILLRCILELPRGATATERQFAVIHTIGRGDRRTMGIDFVSAWHRW